MSQLDNVVDVRVKAHRLFIVHHWSSQSVPSAPTTNLRQHKLRKVKLWYGAFPSTLVSPLKMRNRGALC